MSALHGDMAPVERELIIKEFRSGSSRILVTGDLLAFGLDVQQVNVVVHYDFPQSLDVYHYRVGRAGRFGRPGSSVAFLTDLDFRFKSKLEQFYQLQLKRLPTKWLASTTSTTSTAPTALKDLTDHPSYKKNKPQLKKNEESKREFIIDQLLDVQSRQ